jgi:type II secretory pathway component PulK
MFIVMVVLLVVAVLATMAVNWTEQVQLQSPKNASQNAESSARHTNETKVA